MAFLLSLLRVCAAGLGGERGEIFRGRSRGSRRSRRRSSAPSARRARGRSRSGWQRNHLELVNVALERVELPLEVLDARVLLSRLGLASAALLGARVEVALARALGLGAVRKLGQRLVALRCEIADLAPVISAACRRCHGLLRPWLACLGLVRRQRQRRNRDRRRRVNVDEIHVAGANVAILGVADLAAQLPIHAALRHVVVAVLLSGLLHLLQAEVRGRGRRDRCHCGNRGRGRCRRRRHHRLALARQFVLGGAGARTDGRHEGDREQQVPLHHDQSSFRVPSCGGRRIAGFPAI